MCRYMPEVRCHLLFLTTCFSNAAHGAQYPSGTFAMTSMLPQPIETLTGRTQMLRPS